MAADSTRERHDKAHKVRPVHRHRDVHGGWARAAVFGVSDGLVSNVALILGVAGASTDAPLVRVAGISGLLAGAFSMAAGEYVSVKAQNELIEREIDIERRSIEEKPEAETNELAAIYEQRGIRPAHARQLAVAIMADPEVALDVHAREELGVAPDNLGSPLTAAWSSFAAFSVGALLPLVPWFFGGGAAAVIVSLVVGMLAACAVGALVAHYTERSKFLTALRQLAVAGLACAVTFGIGNAFGAQV